VLLGPDDITAVRHVRGEVLVSWRCPCGGTGTLRTGRARRTDRTVG
jgi:hypothetical protein